jgi:glucokinase-like ROK family protein
MTRAALRAHTGLGRSTIAQRLEALLSQNLVQQAGEAASTGGRPATTIAFNAHAGVVVGADLGATHSRVAVADLCGKPIADVRGEIAIDMGPEPVLHWLDERLDELLEKTDRGRGDVRAIGVGLPGPVEFSAGRPVNPPIMPGWDGYPVADRLGERHGVPVLVDNDVNIMALGEHRAHWSGVDHLLYVKVGTGIGCGIVVLGDIYRGDQGAAGDIGHIRVTGHDDVTCECGNRGCLEAVASGRALIRQLTELGVQAATSKDVVRLARDHNPNAVRLVREAGRMLGEVLAGLVNALNPAVIVIGGDVAEAQDQLFAGLRETIYPRSTPLATQRLQITRNSLGDHAGVRGAAMLAAEHSLSPAVIDRLLAAGAPR